MRRLIVILILLIPVMPVFSQSNNKAEEILEEVSKKTKSYKNISAEFIFSLENKEMEINEKNRGSIKINGKKYVVDLPDIGIKVYSDGETMWNYMKDGNQVTISNIDGQGSDLMDPSVIFNIYEKGFKSVYIGETVKSNNTLHQIELHPDKNEYDVSKVDLFIDKNSMMINSAVLYDNDGNLYGIKVKEFDTDIDLPDSYFVFNKSEFGDVEIIDFR
jgi:outer membrane lipoprotein-sorting protein